MAKRDHSILAPSSKEWFYCGYATRFLATKTEETTEASEFGSECHLLAEYYIRQSLKLEDYDSESLLTADELKTSLKHYSEEMERLANGYANYVISTVDYEAKRTGEQPIVLIEQLLEMDYAPDTHGTLDCGIIAGDTLIIIDNKTGFIKVTPFDETLNELNSQLAIYGLYAYKAYKDFFPIKKIRLVVYQQRINNISEYLLTSDELEKWEKEKLIPAAKEALSEDAKANSGVWCKYCPGRNVCRKRAEDALEAVKEVNKPEFMTDEEIEAILPKLDSVISYIDSIKEYCLKKALEGKKWRGFKVVESVTKRKLSDEDAVAKILTDNGYDPYAQKKILSMSELQKMVGSKQFNDLVGTYIIKPKGQAVLAPESDAREELIINKEIK